MIFQKGELKILWPFYANTFIEGISMMVFPFLVLYFLGLGLSYFQTSLIIASFGFSMFLFEVPTGAFADGYGRKFSVILGSIIVAAFTSITPFTTNFLYLVLLWAMIGAGMTLISGAEEAWAIDNLDASEKQALRQEFFIKSNSLRQLGQLFAPILGAIFVRLYSVRVLWFFFAAGFLLNAIIVIFWGKEYRKASRPKFSDTLQISLQNSKIGFSFVLQNKVVFFLVIGGLFMQLMTIGFIGFQPFLVELGLKDYQLGYLYSISAGAAVIASFGVRNLQAFHPKNIVSIIVAVFIISNFCLFFIKSSFLLGACTIFILNNIILSITKPLLQTYFNKFIPSDIRATTMSVSNMMIQFVIALSSLVAGILLDLLGPAVVLGFGGMLGFGAIYFYQKIAD